MRKDLFMVRPWPASHLHMPSSRRTVTGPHALLSQSKCTDKESLCILYSFRATQSRECHYSRESSDQNQNTPPQILLPSPTAWQDITAVLWVDELRLCYWWFYRPQISITQTQSLSRDMATVAAIEGVRQFALCHQSNQPTHIHKQMCMHHFHSNPSHTMLLDKIKNYNYKKQLHLCKTEKDAFLFTLSTCTQQ